MKNSAVVVSALQPLSATLRLGALYPQSTAKLTLGKSWALS